MKTRKILAGLMALSVVASMSSMTAFAAIGTTDVTDPTGATGSVEVDGTFEGTVDTDVFSVVLPAVSNELDFIMDPAGLIKETNGAKYTSETFADGTLFFKNVGGTKTYSNTSDKLTITNKSSFDVDVTVSASVTDNTGITLTSDSTFADDKSASMYLALKDVPDGGGDPTVAPITDKGATLTAKIDKAPEGAYEYKYADSKYSYALKADLSQVTFKEYSFQLTGAANAKGDWSGVEAGVAPKANVTWSVVKHQTGPVFSTTTISSSAPSLTVTAPEGVTLTSIMQKPADDSWNYEVLGTKNCTVSNGTYTFNGIFYDTTYLTFVFSNGTQVVVTSNP